jgi:hypothetical protein
MLKQKKQQTKIKDSGRKAAADAEIVAKVKEERYRETSNLQTILSLGGKEAGYPKL